MQKCIIFQDFKYLEKYGKKNKIMSMDINGLHFLVPTREKVYKLKNITIEIKGKGNKTIK